MSNKHWYTAPETAMQEEFVQQKAKQKKSTSEFAPGRIVDQARRENPESIPFEAWVKYLQRLRLYAMHRFGSAGEFFTRKSTLMQLSVVVGLVIYIALPSSDGENAEMSAGRSIKQLMGTTQTAVKSSKPEKKAAKAEKPSAKTSAKASKNEAAPVAASEMPKFDAKAYINKFKDIARTEMYKYGVPASISLAQGLIESRAGTSKLAVENNNHFGMKCFSKKCGKGHCTNFTDDTHKDFFLKFKNPGDSWRQHSVMISSGRYAYLKKYGRDYRRWAFGLKAVGYATDRTYAEKLIGVIQRYDLDRYDH